MVHLEAMNDIDEAILFLKSDPVMAMLIEKHDRPVWNTEKEVDLFADIVSSIISQQLSVRVADVIETRVYNLLPEGKISHDSILSLDSEQVRACGVSYAKIQYIKAAAEASLSGLVKFDTLVTKSDEEVIESLTAIKGIGRWTAEMLLMSSLHRLDIFSLGDLGLRTAVSMLYNVERNDLRSITEIANQWSPYRTVASKYLWKSLHNEPLIATP